MKVHAPGSSRSARLIGAGIVILAVSLGGIWLAHWPATESSPPSTSPATDQPVAATAKPKAPEAVPEPRDVIQALVRNLSSPDAAERERALTQLAQLPKGQFFLLRSQTADVRDPSIAALLKNRLDEMEEQLALAPLPISVHAKNVALRELVDVLNYEMQCPPGRLSVSGLSNNPLLYIIDMDKQPFWEVVREMARQGSIHFTLDDGVQMSNSSSFHIQDSTVQGPFFFAAGLREAPPTRGGTTTATAAAMLILTTIAGVDPRIHVLDWSYTHGPVVDDLGNTLFTPPAPGRGSPFKMYLSKQVLTNNRALQRPAPPKTVGTKIPSIKMHADILIALRVDRVEIDNVARHVGETFKIGNSQLTLKNFASDSQIWLDVEMPARQLITFELTDAQGWLFDRFTISGTQRRGAGRGQGGPYKLRLIAPQKTRTVSLDFEIKDLPLPTPQ